MHLEDVRQWLELVPEAAVVVDELGRLHACNRRMASWLPSWAPGASDWLEPGSGDVLRRALSSPCVEPPELELELAPAGAGRWVAACYRKLAQRCEGIATAAWLLTLRDCTRQRLLRRERDTELRRLSEAVKARAIGIYEHDHETDEIHASAALRAQYGLDPVDQLSIGSFAAATHPHDGEFLLGEIARAHDPEGGGSFDVRHRILIPSGDTRWLHTRATTTFRETEAGGRRPHRTLGSCIDITREHENELAVRRLAAIMDASPDVAATTHLDGRLTYLNRAGRMLLGIGGDADLGARHVRTLVPEALHAQFEHTVVTEAIARGHWRGEFRLRGADGRDLSVSLVVLALEQPRSAGAYLSIIAHDLTEQKQLEAQLRHAQKLEAVGRLAGGIAHDFNNLLSVVFSFASLVRHDPQVPEPARLHIEEILRAGKRAADLTTRLLTFSRKQVLEPRVVCVVRVLRSLVPMVERLAGETICVQLRAGSGEMRVKVDPGQLELVLMNLVVNARDAMPRGGVLRFEADVDPVDDRRRAALGLRPGTHVVIRVSDTGCGMSREIQSRIFEPFFTTKAPGEGTGLGLSTAFGIVAQSGGSITASSEEHRGSTFEIYLPSTEEPLHCAPPAQAAPAASPGAVILVVEDEPQLRNALASLLSSANYQPVTAAGAAEALELVCALDGHVDLVLTDIVMPDLRGQELAARLAAQGSTAPVLYMSGYTGDGEPEAVLAGAAGFLAKPFTSEQLLDKVSRVLGARHAVPEQRPHASCPAPGTRWP